ncbi:hypothetical protein [Saccharomonospora marina]|uniref:hypothetical protein n=1 Tax=Saccharomonospora marina TaxID=632569 RepID=UPI001E3FF058|nr:hypothetical protein [Saccharomonospora marina]
MRRAVERETGPWYARKDAGDNDSLPPLRRIGFLLLELGFTVAEEGGIVAWASCPSVVGSGSSIARPGRL